ncbi:hypothetical protein FQZ34_24080, partial [Escherichia coli]|nr:hypothetical protein [Escherichia coli]MXD78119.1 hypothetical protein [Escherichia coli]
LPSETMIWQPEFTDKTLSRKPGAVHIAFCCFIACFSCQRKAEVSPSVRNRDVMLWFRECV